jgi:hypothetical protein
MTVALAFWLIFKTIALSLAALLIAALAISFLVGGGLAAHEDVRPRFLPATLLAAGLGFTGLFIITAGALAQVIMA